MKVLLAMIATAVFAAGPAFARTTPQTPSQAPAQPARPTHVQPGVAAPNQQTQSAPAPATPQEPAPQKVDPEKEKAIRHLMDITGTAKLGNNMTEVVALQVKNAMSRRLPADKLDKFMSDFNQKLSTRSPSNEVVDAQVPIYAQHFSMEELQGMIQFYESPVGQQMVKALPDVLQESQKTGAEIERKAALDTLKDMSNDYPELKPMLPSDEQKPSLGPGGQPQPQSPKPQGSEPQQPQKPQSQPQPQPPAKPQE
ncbi:MAG TPA: DUF2059 domain-containing protein [Candidatus Acidoferrales bacterium]|nr:DUF2059 domain-containing protein [Candidatus Acidoferrales bacterium]